MASRIAKSVRSPDNPARAFPLPVDHWQAIVQTIGLSDQLTCVLELVLCDLGDKEIAAELGLGLGTIKDYLQRIGRQTKTNGRVQLIVHVMVVSHALLTGSKVHPND